MKFVKSNIFENQAKKAIRCGKLVDKEEITKK